MPRPATRLELDFSSLLGPLFFMWLMQLLLPVNVYALVHEKECGLRMMMRLQGLSDRSVILSSDICPIIMVWWLCIGMTSPWNIAAPLMALHKHGILAQRSAITMDIW